MRPIILTIISEKELPVPPKQGSFFQRLLAPDTRLSYLRHFTAVNVKFGAYQRGFGKLLDQAGCERHAWEYLTMRSLADAEKLAKQHAEWCAKYKIQVFNANMEAGWSGTKPHAPYPNPYQVGRHYVKVFRLFAPTYTQLWYNGWSWSVTADGRRLHDAAFMGEFDAYSPMNYGTTARVLEKFWNDKCFKYRNRLPKMPVIPMIGVGRIDADGAIWGFWNVHRHLLTTTPVDGVNFYFGNGAKTQMLVGHPKHPALVACVQDLRDQPGWEKADV